MVPKGEALPTENAEKQAPTEHPKASERSKGRAQALQAGGQGSIPGTDQLPPTQSKALLGE